ncbi:MAG: PilZ domain-containing protein [Aureliella sp.]
MNSQPLRYFENAEGDGQSRTSDVCVTCARNVEATPFRVQLVELNSSAIKFLTSEPLSFQDLIRLHFTSISCKLEANLQAEVRWHRRKGKDWMVGAVPTLGIPDSMLQSLAIAGAVERRASERCQVDVAVQVREVGQTERKVARIVEYSEGGVRLKLSSESLEYGQPLKLFLEVDGRESAFQLNTCWVGKGKTRLAGFAVAESQASAFRAALAKHTGDQVSKDGAAGLNRWLRKAKRCVTDRPTLRS